MLKRVRRDEVRLGMFIQGFEGSWMEHPFWRKRFVLTRDRDLERLRASSVDGVIIDTAAGADVEAPSPEPSPIGKPLTARPTIRRAAERPTPSSQVPADGKCSEREEAARAAKIVTASKQAVTRMFGEARMGRAVTAQQVSPLIEEISQSVRRNQNALLNIVRLKSKDEYTYLHSVAVCAMMINLARELGFDEGAVKEAGMAGLLHDVGKMAVPDPVLNKPGGLTDDEFALVRAHPERGHDLLKLSGTVPEAALDVCLHHHEKMDGTGYPHRLAGDQISLIARMGAVCDVYDAITSARPYKDPWTPAESLARMEGWSGHFDGQVLAAFVRSLGIHPIGSLVRLRSGRLGVVVREADGERKPQPVVRAFYSTDSLRRIEPRDVVTGKRGGDAIVASERPDRWGLADWPRLRAELMAA